MLRFFLSTMLLCMLTLWVAGARKLYNLRARYDHRENAIYTEWEARPDSDFALRYRLNTENNDANDGDIDWQFASTHRHVSDVIGEDGASFYSKLRADIFGNNDELLVQVKPTMFEDWGKTLVISIAKRLPSTVKDSGGGDSVTGETELEPPRNFTANVLTADAIRLEWIRSTSEAGLYYMVDIRQMTANNPSRRPIEKQIKVESDNFLLDDLTPGERYELTIRSATSASRVSSTAAIVVISLPRKEEFFEVGNLVILSRFKTDGSGTVNLTWKTPAALHGKIVAYAIQYAEKSASLLWQRVLFSGDSPTVLLHNLKCDTEYLLTIKTRLTSGIETESGQFRFRTPRVPANPINRVNVIYSSETSAIRLQWVLADHINPMRVAGYDVFISEDKDINDELWRRVPTTSPTTLTDASAMAAAAEVLLQDLRPGHVYYIKIKVRMTDGTTIDAPFFYKFTSTDDIGLASVDMRVRRAERPFPTLTHSNRGGNMLITWSYKSHILDDIAGARVFYTNRPDRNWQIIDIEDSIQKQVILTDLQPHTVYFVRIVPLRRAEGVLDFANAESLQVRTK